jgi:hypothetical protein
MTIIPASLDYTDRDFASLRLRLQALVRSVFPAWTDQNTASFGNLLLELYAFVGDVLTFYQDNQAREARLVTATQRKNVISLAKMLGYAPQGAEAAVALETLTLSAPPVHQVTIPEGTSVLTASITAPVAFQLTADAVFAPGLSPPSVQVVVENSATTVDSFDATGLPSQSVVLSRTPYLEGSTAIVAADGTYTEVDNFLASGPTDRHFTVVVDQVDRATVVFGDGVLGTIPSGSIAITYKTGGGLAGNVEAGAIMQLQGTFYDGSVPVIVSATNVQKAQGGLDRQTLAQIQTAAPASLRANTRTVAREDFEINALRVSGIARALMTTSNQDPAVPENSGILYLVPVGGGLVSSTKRDEVLTMVTVTYPSTLTFRVTPQVASYAAINVFLRVYKAKGVLGSQVALNLRTTLATYFAIQNPDGTPNTRIDFGANYLDANGLPSPSFALGPLFDALEETSGVRKLGGLASDFLLNGVHQDVVLQPKQFPTLGTVTILDGDTGATL